MPTLSRRTAFLHPSPIREILAVIERPGMVSFAGGLPSPESFPAIGAGDVPAGFLQYGPTEGEPALRERIATNLRPECAQRLVRIAGDYRDKRDAFAAELARHFSGLADWAVPEGGLFFWLKLRTRFDTRDLLQTAIDQGVAFMPGEAFFPDPADGFGTMRLNFSHASADEAERGLAVLAGLVAERAATSASASAPSRHSRAG